MNLVAPWPAVMPKLVKPVPTPCVILPSACMFSPKYFASLASFSIPSEDTGNAPAVLTVSSLKLTIESVSFNASPATFDTILPTVPTIAPSACPTNGTELANPCAAPAAASTVPPNLEKPFSALNKAPAKDPTTPVVLVSELLNTDRLCSSPLETLPHFSADSLA